MTSQPAGSPTGSAAEISAAGENAAALAALSGDIVVIKYGGNAMTDAALKERFAQDIAAVAAAGLKPVVVHGGGPQISALLASVGVPGEFRGGYRVTTAEAMKYVQMALVGEVAPELVGLINRAGGTALGLGGHDGGLLRAVRRTVLVDGVPTDVGQVGDIEHVEAALIHQLLGAGYIPVISTVAPDSQGVMHNINADTAASAIAVALQAQRLIVLTDVAGVYTNWPDKSSLAEHLTLAEVQALLPTVDAGMVPKLEACTRALRAGVTAAQVIDGRVAHSIFAALTDPASVGTLMTEHADTSLRAQHTRSAADTSSSVSIAADPKDTL